MHKKIDKDKMMTIVLMDIMKLSLPRIRSIRSNLDKGGTLNSFDLDFIHEELDKITRFYRNFQGEEQSDVIFRHFSHLLAEVVSMALENESKQH